MTGLTIAEAIAGGLLVFFVPGYALTKAVFPEWRVSGPDGLRRLLEIVTLAFVASLALTIVVGYGLLSLAPGGFIAAWSNPVLETVLLGVAVVALAAAWVRGAFARTPPVPSAAEPDPGEEGAWEVSRELERLGRAERRLEHDLRVASHDPAEKARIASQLDQVREERDALRRRREEQYAA